MEVAEIVTKQGKARGRVEDGVASWKGLPYAKPPVGELRFRMPQPPEAWEGVRDASSFGAICPQPKPDEAGLFGFASPGMSEDCLNLNVWAPAEGGSGLPVMVWIHGGSFVTGSGSLPLYDGTQLAHEGRCVVVSLNYRLGPLGFLHLSPLGEDYDSNVGLFDQILALRWVQENAEVFGGDPKNVTLFGESAGSMSIAALLAMPKARGLFARAIMQSGGSQCLSAAQAEQVSAIYLRQLGVDGGNFERLKALPVDELLTAAAGLQGRPDMPALPFQPTIEPATLPVEPLQAVAEGAAAGVPLIVGTNRDEGGLFFHDPAQLMERSAFVDAINAMTGRTDAEAWKDDYPLTVEGQAAMMTDLYFWRAALELAEAQAAHAPVWMYRFDWTLPGHPFFGRAVHAAEIPFAFGNAPLLQALGVPPERSARRISDAMSRAWLAFAATGDPSAAATNWPKYETGDRSTLIFGEDLVVERDPERGKRERLFGLGV
ncbi:para-nitrobenzyl esterase [Saccharibacillus sp. O23]|uniref:carboxylesterase/lipase family protein n=1 Tax=Saccharibacillus sp. O23 TaxID=2009338 RepID=UPI000B4DF5DC|nr:carboxylesterase/lipase family protein [Saccharibacillus sp. O23]OWR28185.1 para-nitrobenzyl esterase [Saccharibacillus sp. O23]